MKDARAVRGSDAKGNAESGGDVARRRDDEGIYRPAEDRQHPQIHRGVHANGRREDAAGTGFDCRSETLMIAVVLRGNYPWTCWTRRRRGTVICRRRSRVSRRILARAGQCAEGGGTDAGEQRHHEHRADLPAKPRGHPSSISRGAYRISIRPFIVG